MDLISIIMIMAVGFAVAVVLLWLRFRGRTRSEDRVLRSYFLLGLSGLMAKIAIADGRVSGDENILANGFFDRMDLTSAEKALCVGNFITARHDNQGVRDHAKRFLAYANPDTCEFLYDLLWRISSADGVLDPAEDALLKETAACLGLDEKIYAAHKSGRRTQFDRDALIAAGVPKSLAALA